MGVLVNSVVQLNRFPALQRSLRFKRPYVLGVAIFDLSGLPTRCFGIDTENSSEWIDTAFNALCLESLLKCGLNLHGFQHLTLQTSNHTIILIKQTGRYLGLLLQKNTPENVITQILTQFNEEQV